MKGRIERYQREGMVKVVVAKGQIGVARMWGQRSNKEDKLAEIAEQGVINKLHGLRKKLQDRDGAVEGCRGTGK